MNVVEDFYIGNFASFYGIFRLALKESMQLLENVIEDYNSLPTSSRVGSFLKSYFLKRKNNIADNSFPKFLQQILHGRMCLFNCEVFQK